MIIKEWYVKDGRVFGLIFQHPMYKDRLPFYTSPIVKCCDNPILGCVDVYTKSNHHYRLFYQDARDVCNLNELGISDNTIKRIKCMFKDL